MQSLAAEPPDLFCHYGSAPRKIRIHSRTNAADGKKAFGYRKWKMQFTNMDLSVSHYHGEQKEAMMSTFEQFSKEDTIQFFHEIGIDLIQEEDGKLYPYSLQASSVVDNLRYEASRLGVTEICEFDAASIRPNKGGFQITAYNGKTFQADKVILAAGGRAASHLGSNGSDILLPKVWVQALRKHFPHW